MMKVRQKFSGIEFDVDVRWDERGKALYRRVIPAELSCPRCRSVALVTVHYTFVKDVVMFRCPKCGSFEYTEGVSPEQYKAIGERELELWSVRG